VIDRELLRTLIYKRRLDDMKYDIIRLTQENPDEAEIRTLLEWIQESVTAIQRLMIGE